MRKKLYLISLGCAKNSVDSESMSAILQSDGYTLTDNPARADVLVVNTCGFIQPARQESIAELNKLARRKKPGQILVAAGCLPGRIGRLLLEQVAGIDGILSTRNWLDIAALVARLRQGYPQTHYDLPESTAYAIESGDITRAARQGAYAYLKIADGCRRPCAFCSIPLIKGKLVSRQPQHIVREALELGQQGVRELILIAQDTTDYDHDLGLKDGLAGLLEQLVRAETGIPWMRILYAYPGYVTPRLIDVLAAGNGILPYLDLPLQHAHPAVLRRMLRPANMDMVRKTLADLRKAIPRIALRSTFIVGYPGETEEEFSVLEEFLREVRLDHVGIFPFSYESGTASARYEDDVSPQLKQERLQRLANVQEQISLQRNQSFVGEAQQVLIEGYGDGISIGRAWHDAPEIDGMVLVEGKLPVDDFAQVRITGAMTHDLSAVPLK